MITKIKENSATIITLVGALILLWAISGFVKMDKTERASSVQSAEDVSGRAPSSAPSEFPYDIPSALQEAGASMAAGSSDPCAAPEGIGDEEWRQHMSHHPGQYDECLTTGEETGSFAEGYMRIDPNDLAEMLRNKDFTLIDVHIPEQAHISGTDKFIPYNEISMRQDELPQNKDAKIVLYCRSGSMSKIAAEELAALGYTNIYDLEGGVDAWQAAGFPTEKSEDI